MEIVTLFGMVILHDRLGPYYHDVHFALIVDSPYEMVVGETIGSPDTGYYSRILMVIGPRRTWARG